MSPGKCVVELLYDAVSPYSYVGFEIMTRCSREWSNMDLKLRPVLAGGIFKGLGIDHTKFVNTKFSPTSESRARYNQMEIKRFATHYDVPFNHPADFKSYQRRGSLRAQRLVKAVQIDHPERLEDISRSLSQRVFINDLDIYEDDSLLQACTKIGFSQLESSNLLKRISDEDVKTSLKSSTEKAVKEGVFGVPTYFLIDRTGGKEMFFGSDRIFMIAHRLGENWMPNTR